MNFDSKTPLRLAFSVLFALFGLALSAHDYGTNGVCKDAGCDAPYQKPELVDGWYELANAGNVEWFSSEVNAGGNNIFLRGRLVADIDFTGVQHTPIGVSEATKFNGKFDGQGHRILNMKLRSGKDLQGFFGGLRGGGTEVRNLILDKSCTITGKQRVGGIAAFCQTVVEGPIVIENCVNEAPVSGTSTAVGGILGGSMSPHPAIHIRRCVNMATVKGAGESAAIAGWLGDNSGSLVEECYNAGRLTGIDGEKRNMVRHGGASSVRNVFDLKAPSGAVQGAKKDWATKEPLSSGELCYMLNSCSADSVWRQIIGTDAQPMPFGGEEGFVYMCGKAGCDGMPIQGEGFFSNTDEGFAAEPHSFLHGFCQTCGTQQPGVKLSPRKVFITAGQSNADGRPAISTMPQYIQDYVSHGGSRFCYWSYANGSDAAWNMFGGKMVPYMPYTDNNSTSRCGFDGIVYHMLEEELGQRFYVIKESHGGTAIDTRCSSGGNLWWCADPQWLQTASPRGGHSLAKELTENIALCIDNVFSQLEEGYDIQCVIWHQGESDRTQAASYEANLRQLVAYLRESIVSKTGEERYAHLPFLAGTVNRSSTQYNAEVEAALYRLEAQDPDFHVVDMSDCKLGSDVLHFDAAGCEDAAGRMFAMMKKLGLLETEDDEETSIPAVGTAAPSSDSATYDLSGRKLQCGSIRQPGNIYIRNNKKVILEP